MLHEWIWDWPTGDYIVWEKRGPDTSDLLGGEKQ
jgi:hypothetical protein